MRVFIAFDIAENSIKELIAVQNELKELDISCKWVELYKHAHLTLRFWPDLNESQVGDVKNAMDAIKGSFQAVTVVTDKLSSHAQLKRNQVLWFEMPDAFALENIYELLCAQLEIRGLEPEAKEFLAHVTLGRLKARKNLNLYKKYRENKAVNPVSVEFKSISLYKSTLTSDGPVYELLHRI